MTRHTGIKKYFFSILEITLSIGVLSVGIVGTLVLFPVGLRQSSDCIGINYSAIAADNFHAYLSRKADHNWSNFLTDIPSVRPAAEELTEDNWEDIEGNIYKPENVPSGVYGFKIIPCDVDSLKDFSAEILTWKNLKIKDWDISSCDNSKNVAGVYVEVSWPVSKPYYKRDIRKYYFELFNSSPVSSIPPTGNGTYSAAGSEISIDPGNSSSAFVMITPAGEINRDTLSNSGDNYTYHGSANEIKFKPEDRNNKIEINGEIYNLDKDKTYTITSSDMDVTLHKTGKGMRTITLDINAAINVLITPNPMVC